MRSLAFFGIATLATARRIQQDPANIVPDHYDDVYEYLKEHGHDHKTMHRVANYVTDKWPGTSDLDVSNRRMKASQLLSLEERARFWNASGHLNPVLLEVAQTADQPSCGNLHHPLNAACRGDVEWAFRDGRHQPGAGEIYYDINEFAGVSLSQASQDDMQKLFKCGMGNKCGLPPCGCTHPPCDMCGQDDLQSDFDLDFPQQCSMHSACVGQSGDCCPNTRGQHESCCNVVPDVSPVGPPVFIERPHVPGQEIQQALHGGAYLGPLHATRCGSPRTPSGHMTGQTLNQCANLCTSGSRCSVFTYYNGDCKLYVDCHTTGTGDGTMLFVKNTDGMEPHKLPTRKVSGNNHHIFAVGDWGGGSCPGHASMHYVHKQYLPGSERYELDDNAQTRVADAMGAAAEREHPFMVLNAGDNFYWGGVMDAKLGGNGIHDATSFKQGFEDIYKHEDLKVPWLSVMGNHDYGGDGCFANVRAQWDYTIKDLLHNNRWKMPSPYYKHLVEFDDFSAEFFMLDTNVEDSNSGRHGGICAQEICHEVHHMETAPRADCVKWFRDMWATEQKWLRQEMAASTAEWKIIMGHHKPHGPVGYLYEHAVRDFGAQLMIGSHTHEMAFYKSWHGSAPLLVVGAGGGAQGAPGCGGAAYCSGPTGYGFADLAITKNQLEVTIHNHDHTVAHKSYVCRNGKGQENPC